MPRPMSRRGRETAFFELATQMHRELEAWCNEHPNASFGDIEAEARKCRLGLMGETIALLVNGRDLGYQVRPPTCPHCGRPMEFEGYRTWRVNGLEGDTELKRAYYLCAACEEQTLFPLDHKLHLRPDH